RVNGTSAAPAAARYHRASGRCRARAHVAAQAAVPASRATSAARSPPHSSIARGVFPSATSAVASTQPTTTPRDTAGTDRNWVAAHTPSGRAPATRKPRASTPAARGTRVPPTAAAAGSRGNAHAEARSSTASATRERHGRSGELDMSLPRVGGPRSRVHEQGAVGADPRRAAGERRLELPASEPVALPEGDALRFSEAGGVGGEAEESRYQAVEHVEAPHGGEDLRQRDRVVRALRGDRAADVPADAQSQPLQHVALPAALAEDARRLAVHDDDVVGPLELSDGTARELVHDVGQDQPGPDRPDAELPVGRMQQHAQPHAPEGRVPGAAAPAAPRGLLFGDDDGPRRRLSGRHLVNRVEGRAAAAEQAALRHAPATGEGGGGAAVRP